MAGDEVMDVLADLEGINELGVVLGELNGDFGELR
jgi:hypothetical protein